MDDTKKTAIEIVVDNAMTSFAEGLISRYSREVDELTALLI